MPVPLIASVLLMAVSTRGPAAPPTVVLHVAPTGSHEGSGAETSPFRQLEQARDAIRKLKDRGGLPMGGVEVRVHPGHYAQTTSLVLTAQDSGTADAPIVYRASGTPSPRFSGGVVLKSWTKVDEATGLQRLPEEARAQVVQTGLQEVGVDRPIPLELGGFASGRGFRTHPAMELFVDGQPMVVARWPNQGFVKTGEVPGPLSLTAWDRRPGSPEGRFRYEGDRPVRWTQEPDAWLYGYWFWDWADSYEKIAGIDPVTREITLAKPWHTYGFRRDQRYLAVNLLSELDVPGEWYLDRERQRVYLFPPRELTGALVELSVLPKPLVVLDHVSHLRFEGLTWECGAADGLQIQGGSHCQIVGCTFRKMAGNAIEVRGGEHHEIRSCDLHTLGRGGITLAGGDRRSLTPSGHRVENCHIHHTSRIDHTYTPGIWMDGVGHHIRHNLIHHVASSGLRVEGNDHRIELNEVHRVVLESDDQGAVDMFGNPTYRGNVFRYNYWHHLGNWEGGGDVSQTQRAGIRLDDAICGVWVHGNVFQRCSTGRTHFGGVQIHGGKENLVEGNLFVDTAAAASFTPWGEKRWRQFVAQALEAPAIDRDLYLQRYPALTRLAEGHDQNVVRSNVTIRCPVLFLRAPAGTESAGNREFPESTAFLEGGDGRLVWSQAEAARLGMGDIPFEQIGLYADAWRSGRGEAWSLR